MRYKCRRRHAKKDSTERVTHFFEWHFCYFFILLTTCGRKLDVINAIYLCTYNM